MRFTEEQIIGALREQETGGSGADLCEKYGVSEATLYNWKAKYGGFGVPEAMFALIPARMVSAGSLADRSGPAFWLGERVESGIGARRRSRRPTDRRRRTPGKTICSRWFSKNGLRSDRRPPLIGGDEGREAGRRRAIPAAASSCAAVASRSSS